MDHNIHHKDGAGNFKPAPKSKSQFRFSPDEGSVLRMIQANHNRYKGIAAKVANLKSTAFFPIGSNNIESLDYAIQGASEWWPGENDWQLCGADELFDQAHIDSAGIPAGATLMKDPALLGEFSAG